MDQDYALFVQIVASGSLSAAGRIMRLSPPMVSKRLVRLEQRLGAQLIRRTTRRLTTTEAGQAFYEDIVGVLAAAKAAEDRIAGLIQAPSGRLHVSAPTSFGRLHIAPYLKQFLDAHHRIELDLALSDDFVDLIEHRIDLAIRIGPPPQGGLIAQRLAPNRRLLCAAPAYLKAHGSPSTLGALAERRLLAATNQTPWRLTSKKGSRALPVQSALRTNSSEVVRELAIAGYGIALRSTWDVAPELRTGRLVQILPEWEGAADIAILAVHPRTSLVSASVQAFVDFLVKLYDPLPPWER